MTLAWIIYDEYNTATIVFIEPEYYNGRLVSIGYAEILKPTND